MKPKDKLRDEFKATIMQDMQRRVEYKALKDERDKLKKRITDIELELNAKQGIFEGTLYHVKTTELYDELCTELEKEVKDGK